jgi:PiT family inorganic phosphate transporter
MLYLIFVIIGFALVFDFLNGFHDAANSVATVVTTRTLTPAQAVLWAAFFNFVAAFVFGTGVAKTISSNLINPAAMDVYVVFGGLIGGIGWNLLTWYLALPTSSSHALISSLAGAAVTKAGWHVLLLRGWWPVLLFLVLSPLLGMALGYIFMHIIAWLTWRAKRERVQHIFRRLQLVSAGAYSLGHGSNDAQKTMGVIVALLVASGHRQWARGGQSLLGRQHEIALWIILSCQAAMALGTMLGGWRVVRTMGSRITPHLHAPDGFAAELAAALTIFLATVVKVPISTTHAIGGAISGVGATRGWHAVRWIWARRVIYGWFLCFPGAALIGALGYLILRLVLTPVLGAPPHAS